MPFKATELLLILWRLNDRAPFGDVRLCGKRPEWHFLVLPFEHFGATIWQSLLANHVLQSSVPHSGFELQVLQDVWNQTPKLSWWYSKVNFVLSNKNCNLKCTGIQGFSLTARIVHREVPFVFLTTKYVRLVILIPLRKGPMTVRIIEKNGGFLWLLLR